MEKLWIRKNTLDNFSFELKSHYVHTTKLDLDNFHYKESCGIDTKLDFEPFYYNYGYGKKRYKWHKCLFKDENIDGVTNYDNNIMKVALLVAHNHNITENLRIKKEDLQKCHYVEKYDCDKIYDSSFYLADYGFGNFVYWNTVCSIEGEFQSDNSLYIVARLDYQDAKATLQPYCVCHECLDDKNPHSFSTMFKRKLNLFEREECLKKNCSYEYIDFILNHFNIK
jgi:hypothetical protein